MLLRPTAFGAVNVRTVCPCVSTTVTVTFPAGAASPPDRAFHHSGETCPTWCGGAEASDRALRPYASERLGLKRLKESEHVGNQRLKRFKPVAHGNEHHDSDRQCREVLLEFDVLIRREHSVKLGRCAKQKRAVGQARPLHSCDGSDRVTAQQIGQGSRQRFIEQNAHWT